MFKAAAISMIMSTRDPAGFETYVFFVYTSPFGWAVLALLSSRFSALYAILSAGAAGYIVATTGAFGRGHSFEMGWFTDIAVHLGLTFAILLFLPRVGVLGRALIREFGKAR